jgi:O-antigen/teichoic acid export membrane protein
MILSRILTPYDFALIALLNVFLAISNVIVDSGFSQAIIRDDSPSQKDLSSVFYFNIILSCLIYIVLYFLAPQISAYYNAPELTILSRVVFLVIIFNSFSIIQNATLNRSLSFEVLNKSSIIGSFIAALVSIIMAYVGFGIWALVANSVLMPLIRGVLLWLYSNWRPINQFSFPSIKRYLGFGVFLMFQGIIDAISTNLITLIIGKVYTKNDLGYYSQGGKMDGYIVAPFTSIIQKVTYPILSRIKDQEVRLKDACRQIVGVGMFVFIPLMLFTITASENIIVTFFGRQWIEAGIFLKIASFGAILFPLQNIFINVVMLKGKTKMMLKFAFIKQILRIFLLLVFIKKGVLVLALVFSISTLIGSTLYITLGMSYLKYRLSELCRDLYKAVFASFICVGLVGILGSILTELSTYIVLIIQSFIMGISYIMISKILNNLFLKESLLLIKQISNRIVTNENGF